MVYFTAANELAECAGSLKNGASRVSLPADHLMKHS
jgi:hypothetical protein